ncbi:MBL fold metallo-hydrolase [Christensenella tenuis]|jgi:ribonuclease BN (tRNA processing enzyme)|uniref:MBL fold metallo-hydrolase n=1 Tax=Christensenella tenuis TaxID=2763033 RepID=A0ABR7EBX5_9FIRM|nr:MBL fold metallo-hydrolase [Christensenella tenuis]MBC5647270.1 MBL fold metallo-hydrolase [Christensenella tenuis]
MKLTVLGKYGPYPKQGGATTSYLMECGGKKILIDAGSGSLSRVQEYCRLEELDSVVLTHLHSDHCSDMFILRYALRDMVIPVFLPRTPEKEYGILHSCPCFHTSEISAALEILLPETNVKLSFCKTIHPVECYAVKIQDAGKIFVFSGDACRSDDLTEFCRGADVFLCDSGFLSAQENTGSLPHMYVREAAQTAQKAGVGRLLLTHINPAYQEEKLVEEATAVFKPTEVVKEMKQYDI